MIQKARQRIGLACAEFRKGDSGCLFPGQWYRSLRIAENRSHPSCESSASTKLPTTHAVIISRRMSTFPTKLALLPSEPMNLPDGGIRARHHVPLVQLL